MPGWWAASDRFLEATEMLVDRGVRHLGVLDLSKEHWAPDLVEQPQERLEQGDPSAGTDVVGIFPNRAAVIRLGSGRRAR